MKKTKNYFLIFVIMFALSMSGLLAQKPVLERQVFGTGGMVGAVNNVDIKMYGITGQFAIENKRATIPGSTNYNLNQGFWVPGSNVVSGVEEQPEIANRNLYNYPNPVKSSTTIEYNLTNGGYVTIKIYDMVGNEVKSLVNTYHSSGKYTINWDTKNENGIQVGSGSYLYEMQVNSGDLSGANAANSYILRNVMVIAK